MSCVSTRLRVTGATTEAERCNDRDGHPSYNTHLRMYKSREGRGYPANFPSLLANVKCETCAVTLHLSDNLARAPIVQVNAYRTRAITQSVGRNPRSQPKKKKRNSKKAKGTVIAAPAEASAPRWWLLLPLVCYTLLSIVCMLTTMTVSLLGVTRSSTI